MPKERLRLEATERYLRLDLNKESKLDSIAMLASHITQTPVAFVSLMGQEVQWMQGCHGYQVDQMPRRASLCTQTIEQDGIFVVNDTLAHKEFSGYAVSQAGPAPRFYAGTSLRSHDGYNIGTLCVMDIKPNELSEQQQLCLKALAKQVSMIIELDYGRDLLEKSMKEIAAQNMAIERQNNELKKIAQIQSHEFRGPLTSIMALMNLIKYEDYKVDKEYLQMLEKAVNNLDAKIRGIVTMTSNLQLDFGRLPIE